ncbi:hypothetical protein LQ948_01890 [Jiella sp. MQZ9-1]|uniref:hypothetical protein n=1 Tax=Jiella flava TaxID=2816857 RepID=UPI001E2A721F|nr:hypothetical protein [Jiella flava]MCD2469958.1 hypothetical protein [Jiella flava]
MTVPLAAPAALADCGGGIVAMHPQHRPRMPLSGGETRVVPPRSRSAPSLTREQERLGLRSAGSKGGLSGR